jgi:DNA-binding CsgD family transcriptional regulator
LSGQTDAKIDSDLSRILSARQEPGLVLIGLRPRRRVLGMNSVAQQILFQAPRRRVLSRVRQWLRALPADRYASIPALAGTFVSGRRTYSVRSLRLDGRGGCTIALLLERINPTRLALWRSRQRYRLSSRELDVVAALAQGLTDREIAETLGVGAETIRGYLKNIRAKLGVSTRTAIVRKLSDVGSAD